MIDSPFSGGNINDPIVDPTKNQSTPPDWLTEMMTPKISKKYKFLIDPTGTNTEIEFDCVTKIATFKKDNIVFATLPFIKIN